LRVQFHPVFPAAYTCSLILLAVFSLPLMAADRYVNADNHDSEQIRPVELPEPPRPASRFGPGPEGWITLRFTIKADGSVDNIDIIDVMPAEFPVSDTIDTLKSWAFMPAILDGSAMDWHNNILVINFDLPQIPNISGPRFTTPYAEVQALINGGRLDQALRKAGENLKEATYSLHDISLANIQLSTIEMQRQDLHTAHQAISRVTLAQVNQLTTQEMDVALQYRFNIELALGRYVNALTSYERRLDLEILPDDDLMHTQAQQIRKL